MRAVIKRFKAGEPYRVIKPIPISLRKVKGQGRGWIARFVGANISMQADTKLQAISYLRNSILDCYDDWGKGEAEQNPFLRANWQILQLHIKYIEITG